MSWFSRRMPSGGKIWILYSFHAILIGKKENTMGIQFIAGVASIIGSMYGMLKFMPLPLSPKE